MSFHFTLGQLLSPRFRIKHRAFTTLLYVKQLNSKISAFMRNGLVEQAEELFDEMPRKSIVTYNTMIRGYFENGFYARAVALYNQMPVRDIFSYNTVISGLMRYGDVEGAEMVFESMGCKDIVTWNSLISGYLDNDMVGEAVKVFDKMPLKDVVSWNLVIAGLVKVAEFEKAEEMFNRMEKRDVVSWTIMVKAFVDTGRIAEAREIFDDIKVKDIHAWNAMLCGYVQNNFLAVAEGFFQKMPEKDTNSWSLMIDGYVSSGRTADALRLFNEMPQKLEKTWNLIMSGLVKSDLVTQAHAMLEKTSLGGVISWTNIMVGYFSVGNIEVAMKVFELMPAHDTTVWNVAIFGLGENDQMEDGIKLLKKMKQSSSSLDKSTVTSFLTLCSNLPSLNLGEQIHAEAIKLGINSITSVGNALIAMYCRCGSIDSALLEFKSMPCHDVISWNSLICGLAHYGHGREAIENFEKMRLSIVKPNRITFVGVLSACSHAGLVESGKYYFRVMQDEYNIRSSTEHYTCLVDLLGRYGLIDEAADLVNQMIRDGLEVHESIWGALFGACRIHKNIAVAEIAGKMILELDPLNSGVYMILAEMYLACGRRDEGYAMWNRMKDKGVKKQPGCSWIESGSSGKVFLAGDKGHPDFQSISCALNLIYWELGLQSRKEVDYVSSFRAMEEACC